MYCFCTYSHSTKQRSRSPLHPKSLPYHIVTSPSQSPTAKHRPSETVAADTRYAPSHSSRSSTHSGSDIGSPVPLSPTQQTAPSADPAVQNTNLLTPNDQYVTMRRGATMVREESREESQDSEQDDYLDMLPNLTNLDRTYENLRKGTVLETSEDAFYSVPRSREVLPSDSSSSDGDFSRPNSRKKNGRFALPPRGKPDDLRLPELQTRTLPSGSRRVVSQYSAVSREFLEDSPTGALSPTNIRYLPTAAQPLSPTNIKPDLSSKFHSSMGDIRPANDDVFQALNLSPKKPRPKPRKGETIVKRSASAASPNIQGRIPRKSSLPSSSTTAISEAVKDITLHSPQNGAHVRELQGQVQAPPVPHRNYLPSTTWEDRNSKLPALDNPLVAEFPDAEPGLCQKALESHGYDVAKAREEIQVQILLGMRIPNTNADDCRRALNHCQYKIDRAAIWLVERSIELEERRT